MKPKNLGFAAAGLSAMAFAAYLLWSPGPGNFGAPMVTVKVPELGAPELEGKGYFEDKCAECHGENAAGREGYGPPLVHIIYEPNHHGDAAFYLAAKNGVRQHHWQFGHMPPVEGIADAEIESILAYVRTLQKANGVF